MKLPASNMGEEKDENLLGLFWDLANNNEQKRLLASEKLVMELMKKQKQTDDTELNPEVKYALARLVGGLASGRQSARLGFAAALSSLLDCISSAVFDSSELITLMEEKLKILRQTKSEDKGILFGRVFCLLSLIQSNKLLKENDTKTITTVVEILLKLSKAKSYLKRIAYSGISLLIEQVKPKKFAKAIWPVLSSSFEKGWSVCSPELLNLLICCTKHHSTVCDIEFLKTHKWVSQKSKLGRIIGSHSFKHLPQIIAETTACHPQIDSFAMEIISTIAQQGAEKLGEFWSKHLTKLLFSSTPERKYLGLKLAVHSLGYATAEQVPLIWSKDLLANLYHALLNKDNPLHLICKEHLPKDLAVKLSQENVSADVQYAVLFQTFSSPGGIHLDGMTHTAIVSSIVSHFKLPAVLKYIEWLKHLFVNGTTPDTGIREINLDVARKWSSSQLTHLIRMNQLPRNEKWVSSIINFLFLHSHFTVKPGCKKSNIAEIQMIGEHFMELTEATRLHLRQNHTNAISWLNNMVPLPSDETMEIPKKESGMLRLPGVMSSGDFWLSQVLSYANKLLLSSHTQAVFGFDSSLQQIWSDTMSDIQKMSNIKHLKTAKASEATALELLFLHVGLQLLSFDAEVQKSSAEVIKDLRIIIDERFCGLKNDGNASIDSDSEQPHWVEVIIEILLSMLSQGSHGARKTADQVFRLVCPHLTRTGLNLITDVLQMKDESLMKEKDEEEEEEQEEGNGDKEKDNEDDDNEWEDQSDSDSSGGDSDSEPDVDEEFRKRIKEALGDAAGSIEEENDPGEESESDEDFSDDAMMRIDHVLSDIFKQRKKSKKAKEKNAKLQITHFQLRCLDLIEMFINRQHADNPLVLDLALPLLEVVEKASRDAEKETLAERASVVLRVRLCKMKGYPRDLDSDVISRCHDYIETAISQCHRATSGVFLTQLASHCCMFYLRVLTGNSGSNASVGAVDETRVCQIYASALQDFMTRRESKLQHCILRDFITRYPAIAQGLIAPLTTYIKDGVQVYRKTQACQLLHSLFLSPQSKGKAHSKSQTIIESIKEIIARIIGGETTDTKPKYLAEIIRLLYSPVQATKNNKELKEYDWTSLIALLQKFLELPEVTRSQEVTHATWKVLTALGISRVRGEKIVKEKKKTKKRKRKRTQSEGVDDDTTEQQENDLKSDEKQESRRVLKARIQKEKRKAQAESKPKKKKTKDTVMNGDNEVLKTKSKKGKRIKQNPASEAN